MTATASGSASAPNGNLFTTTQTSASSSVAISYTYVPATPTPTPTPTACPGTGPIGRIGVHHQKTLLILPFVGPVNPVLAGTPGDYVVITRTGRKIPIISANYNPSHQFGDPEARGAGSTCTIASCSRSRSPARMA